MAAARLPRAMLSCLLCALGLIACNLKHACLVGTVSSVAEPRRQPEPATVPLRVQSCTGRARR